MKREERKREGEGDRKGEKEKEKEGETEREVKTDEERGSEVERDGKGGERKRKIESEGDSKGGEREREGGRETIFGGRCGSSNRWKPAGWRKHAADLWLRPADEHRERARKHGERSCWRPQTDGGDVEEHGHGGSALKAPGRVGSGRVHLHCALPSL